MTLLRTNYFLIDKKIALQNCYIEKKMNRVMFIEKLQNSLKKSSFKNDIKPVLYCILHDIG